MAKDFSTFAYMIEEYVGLAATTIAVSASSPEASLIDDMPPVLRRRIQIVDDVKDRHAVIRLLEPLFEELRVLPREGELSFRNDTDPNVQDQVLRLYRDMTRLALGFNHGLQVSVQPAETIRVTRQLRAQLRNPVARAILAQLEGVLRSYDRVNVLSPVPSANTPNELIAIFDLLLNDEAYLSYTHAFSLLRIPKDRRALLARVRTLARRVVTDSRIKAAWACAKKVIHVKSGAEVPEVADFASVVSLKSFPVLVDLTTAKERAVEIWLSSPVVTAPCSRDGEALSKGNVVWLPPIRSFRGEEGNYLIGGVDAMREVAKALDHALRILEGTYIKSG